MNARVLKFLSYVPLNTKFENLVCKISQKVFEVEPSYLVYWSGLRSRSPDQLLRTLLKILIKLRNFEILSIFFHFSVKFETLKGRMLVF